MWRPAIVAETAEEIIRRGSTHGLTMHWLPAPTHHAYLADPFALWRDGNLYVFVESFDYRDRIGRIDVLTYSRSLRLLDWREALRAPWHLSYPFVFEADGEIWMLPEATQSGRLSLYRAVSFPDRWEHAAVLLADQIVMDASILFRNGLWWMFSSSAPSMQEAQDRLTVHFAESLTGPWHPHPAGPVRTSSLGGRPGGTPIVVDDRIVLPVQDCSRTYGGAVNPLWFDQLDTKGWAARLETAIGISPDLAPFTRGMHTLSAAGPVTLIDVKRYALSPRTLVNDVRWKTRQAYQSLPGRMARASAA